jgi:DNA-binding CsgD family transcriptional regulator
MNNKRWTSEEKRELMNLYSKGKTYTEIGNTLSRSPNAIKLRVEYIVYKNLVGGKSPEILAKILNANIDTIQQHYYSHKSFRQNRGEPTQDVDFVHAIANTNNNTEKIINPIHSLQNGGALTKEDKLKKLQNENYIMAEIIKNYHMKRQLRKLLAKNN